MSIRYTLRHNIPDELVSAENDKYESMSDVNDSSTYDFDLMRKHELAETQSGSVVYRRGTGEIVDWATATNQRGEELLAEMEERKQDVIDMISDLSTYIENAETSIDGSVEEAQGSLDGIVESANESLLAVQEAQESIENMIDIEAITITEINDVIEEGD